MKKEITITLLILLISIGMSAQQGSLTFSFSGINSNNQNVVIDSILVENVSKDYDTTLVKPNLSIIINWPLGIEENMQKNFYGSLIYPNPFSGHAVISVNNYKNQKVTISVIDITGRTICENSRELSEGVHNYQYSASNPGIYHVIISNGKQRSVLKAVSNTRSNTTKCRVTYLGTSGNDIEKLKSSLSVTGFPFQPGDVLRFTAYAANYPSISITDSPSANNNYIFTFSQFLRLSAQVVETSTPCFVDMMFQVTDGNYIGVDNLTTESFIVKEDNQPVSPTETFMHIKKRSSIPYQIKTVLLLDNSASAAPNLEQIKNAALTLVNNIVDKQEVAIMVFSDQTTLLIDFTDNINDLVAAIESIQPGFPSTNLYGSIIEAVSMWNDYYSINLIRQGFLVALTDGDDTQGSSTLNQALNAIGSKRVYMIGLGNEINSAALEQLANPGPLFNPTQANELVEIFSEIQNDIVKYANSFYWMNYMSPKREGNHSLTLEIANNTNTGNDSYISGGFYAGDFYSAYSGVYINTNDTLPYGKDTIYIYDKVALNLNAVTYWAYESPVYEWATSNSNIVEIIYDELDNSRIEIFAHGDTLDFATISITDALNNYTNSVYIEINSYGSAGTYNDPRDGQTYNIHTIGSQTWFAENLNYETSNSWCYDYNANNCNEYGRIYKLDAAENACPSGWHLPSDDEWKTLEMVLGMSQSQANTNYGWRGTDEGEKMKSTSGWSSIGTGTNSSGFTALPGGMFSSYSGMFHSQGTSGYWWSSTSPPQSEGMWARQLYFTQNKVKRFGHTTDGLSVRCIKD